MHIINQQIEIMKNSKKTQNAKNQQVAPIIEKIFALGKNDTITIETRNAIVNQLENAQPTLKTSDYFAMYLGHSNGEITKRAFLSLDFWLDTITETEAKEHLKIMTETNEAFLSSYYMEQAFKLFSK